MCYHTGDMYRRPYVIEVVVVIVEARRAPPTNRPLLVPVYSMGDHSVMWRESRLSYTVYPFRSVAQMFVINVFFLLFCFTIYYF